MNDDIEPGGFWEGKSPCWQMRGCIADARERCSAYRDQSRPCWQQESLCKKLFGIDTCFTCAVRKRYGNRMDRIRREDPPGRRDTGT